MTDTTTPGDRIRAEIERDGPMPFDRFMQLSLYGDGGFFAGEHPVGADAAFVTSPHVSAFVFSRSLRAAIVEGWAGLDEPDPLTVVELGAGDGTLGEALREAFGELPQPALDYLAVEIGDGARARLIRRGLRGVRTIDELEPFDGVVVANELLDNLPFLLVERAADSVRELRVGLGARGELTRVRVPWTDGRIPVEDLPSAPDDRATAPVGAAEVVAMLARRLRRGYALFIDYGARGPAGAERGYAGHRELGDVLAVEPGTTDITAGVDVDLVARLATRAGLQAFEPVRQSAALDALGYRRWNDTMRERQVELEREGSASKAVRVWQARSRASLLVDPARLGGLWWLVLSTPGLPQPAWLDAARQTPGGSGGDEPEGIDVER